MWADLVFILIEIYIINLRLNLFLNIRIHIGKKMIMLEADTSLMVSLEAAVPRCSSK